MVLVCNFRFFNDTDVKDLKDLYDSVWVHKDQGIQSIV